MIAGMAVAVGRWRSLVDPESVTGDGPDSPETERSSEAAIRRWISVEPGRPKFAGASSAMDGGI
jgi:hypothetical protein